MSIQLRRTATFFLALLCFIITNMTYAQKVVKVYDELIIDLHEKAGFLEDAEANESLQEVVEKEFPIFSNNNTKVDPTIKAYWFHLPLVYNGKFDYQNYYLIFSQYIDTIALFTTSQKELGFQQVIGGACIPHTEKSMALYGYKKHVLPVSLAKGDTVALYGRMVVSSYLASEMARMGFRLMPSADFLVEKSKGEFLRGGILSMLALLFVLNLLLIGYYRDKIQFLYVANLFFILVFYLSFFGYGALVIPVPSWFFLKRMMDLVMGGLSIGVFLVFMHYYLKPGHTSQVVKWLVAVLCGTILIALFIGLFSSYRTINTMLFATGAIASLLAGYLSLMCSMNGYRPARYFLAATSVSIVGMLLFSMTNFHWIPDYHFSDYILPVGEVVRSVFVTMGVFSYYRLTNQQLEQKKLEQERLKIKQKQLYEDLLKRKNKVLEKEVIRRTKALEQQTKALKKSNRVKDKLFSIVSHDLRSPLAALDGFLQLMKMRYLSEEEIDEMLASMRVRLRKTQELVDNLLYWARTQMNGISARPQVINLKELAKNVSAILEEDQKIKNIRIVNEMPPQLLAWADRDMIQLVIQNLLANALKFTPKNGHVFLRGEKQQDVVYMEVIDTGIGIKEEDLNKIMSANDFFSTKGTEQEIGTGLGLIVCQEFVQKNGGHISVTSHEGLGTTFHFTLPEASQIMELEKD